MAVGGTIIQNRIFDPQTKNKIWIPTSNESRINKTFLSIENIIIKFHNFWMKKIEEVP